MVGATIAVVVEGALDGGVVDQLAGLDGVGGDGVAEEIVEGAAEPFADGEFETHLSAVEDVIGNEAAIGVDEDSLAAAVGELE